MSSKERLLLFSVPPLASVVIRTLGKTWRVQHQGHDYHAARQRGDGSRRVIYSLWHDSIILMCHQFRDRGGACLISNHRDGELIARVAQRLDFETVRGSSTRGGAAGLKGVMRVAKKGRGDLGITPDGPKGPRHEVKTGILFAASASGLPIVPLGSASDRYWEFRSWDRHRVPKPFARIQIVTGEQIVVPRGLDEASYEAYRVQLQDAMDDAHRRACERLKVSQR